jgi:hypothetical protein
MTDTADARTATSVSAEGEAAHGTACGCEACSQSRQDFDHVSLAGEDVGTEPREEDEADSDADAEQSADTPRKTSRSRRLKNRLKLLLEENAGLRRLAAAASMPSMAAAADVPPRPEDFGNDRLAYDRALHQYAARQAVREEYQRLHAAEAAHRAAVESRARLAAYHERLSEVRDRIPDFDQAMLEARDLHIRADLQELIRESPKGPLIAYYLARNLDRLDDLNRLPPVQAAREIGRLEARIRGPQPNVVTKAPPPVSAPKGGTASPARDPSRMSMEDFVRWREAGNG